MAEKYRKFMDSMKYIKYVEPLVISEQDAYIKYPKGGVILYKRIKDEPGKIRVLAYITYDEKALKEKPASIRQKALEIAGEYCHIEELKPVLYYELKKDAPLLMCEDEFYEKLNDNIIDRIKILKSVYDVQDSDIIIVYKNDREYDGYAYYGYFVKGKIPDEDYVWISGLKTVSFEDYSERVRKHKESFESGFDEDDEDFEDDTENGDLHMGSLKAADLSPTALRIRKWLMKVSYNEFHKAIEKRVVGQENLKIVTIYVYNYLENIAYGRTPNNNILLAAPSGCGKTETYRAISDYFKENLKDVLIYTIDMSLITEEAFKGKNPSEIMRPFAMEEKPDGIGIVFMDEFDKKLLPSFESNGTNINATVQNQLLTTIEGTDIPFEVRINGNKRDVTINSRNTMFIGLGSYESARFCYRNFEDAVKENDPFYTDITKEDIINIGGSHELLGRFSTVVNYYKLKPESVDRIIDIATKNVSDSIGMKVVIADSMKEILHENSNGKYGNRLLDSLIRYAAMKGYMETKERNLVKEDYYLNITGKGEAEIKRKEAVLLDYDDALPFVFA